MGLARVHGLTFNPHPADGSVPGPLAAGIDLPPSPKPASSAECVRICRS